MTHPSPQGTRGTPHDRRGDFVRRLGIYCVGIAIGLVMVGMFQRGRVARQPAPDPASSAPSATQGAPPPAPSASAPEHASPAAPSSNP